LILHDYAGRRGGAEIIVQDLRQRLRQLGHDARLLTTNADPFSASEAPDYICRGNVGPLRAISEAYNPTALTRLRAAISDFRPDVVHLLMFLTQLSPAVLALLGNLPTVFDINTFRPICPTGTRWIPGRGICGLIAGDNCRRAGCFSALGVLPRRVQLNLLARHREKIDLAVAPSRTMAQILEENGWPVDAVIPYGVPDAGTVQEKFPTPLFGYAARLVPEKGVDWLLSAFATAFGPDSEARLVIIGDGPERGRLEALSTRLGIAHRTSFPGHKSRSETQRLLGPAWAQVTPSLWPEPFGLVTAEALMRGTPAIVSDQGASREIVADRQTGLVVPANDVNALAAALTALAADRDRAVAMGKAARAAALELYSEDRWLASYLDIYDKLLTKYGRNTA